MTNTSGARRGIGILRSGKAEIRIISERATPDELRSAECGVIESNPRRGRRVASSFAKASAGQVATPGKRLTAHGLVKHPDDWPFQGVMNDLG